MTAHQPHQSRAKDLAVVWYLIGAALTLFGFVTIYVYDPLDTGFGKIVSADAYNFVIIAVRGLGWIVAGLSAIVVGTGCYLVSVIQGAERSVTVTSRLAAQGERP